jgi:hypothetical protein
LVAEQVIRVQVRRQWNRLRKIAVYRLDDVADIRWRKFSGGLGHKANRLYLHGYVMCDQMVEGRLAHSCQHGPAPHRVKVCITRKGNEGVWEQVLGRVEAGGESARVENEKRGCG